MENLAQERFQQVLSAAAKDPEYQRLRHRLEELDLSVLAVLEKLEPEDQTVIREYIRALGASALRLTELACESISQRL